MIIRNPCRPSECVPSGRPRPNGAQAAMSQTKRSCISGCLYGTDPYTAWTSVCLGPEMQSVFCSPLSTLGDQTRWGPWTPQEGFPGDHVWTPVVTAREQPRGHPGGPPWVPTRWINTGSPTACHPSRRLSIQLVPGDTLGCPPGCPLGGPQGGGCLGPQEFIRKFLPRVFSVHRCQLGALGVSRG